MDDIQWPPKGAVRSREDWDGKSPLFKVNVSIHRLATSGVSGSFVGEKFWGPPEKIKPKKDDHCLSIYSGYLDMNDPAWLFNNYWDAYAYYSGIASGKYVESSKRVKSLCSEKV